MPQKRVLQRGNSIFGVDEKSHGAILAADIESLAENVESLAENVEWLAEDVE